MYYDFRKKKKKSSTTVQKQIRNVFLSSIIRMISEGSCDIEDWSNDAENTA